MGSVELKEYIKLQMETADERVLRIVASVFDSYEEPKYNENDENLNLLAESVIEYNKMIDDGLRDIKNGNVLSHTEMKIELEKIKNKQ